MDGKRFGVGIAAGLLFGLAIISASGNLGAVLGSPSVFFGPAQSGGTVHNTATNTATLTQTVTTAASTSTSGTPLYVTSGNTTDNMSGGTTTASSAATNAVSDLKSLQAAISGLTPPSDASRFDSISQQSPLTNAVVLVPLLVALLLGAVLYRKSNRNREKPSEA